MKRPKTCRNCGLPPDLCICQEIAKEELRRMMIERKYNELNPSRRGD